MTNLCSFYFSVFHASTQQLQQYKHFTNNLLSLCGETDLTNQDKLYVLNVAMGEYYAEREHYIEKKNEIKRLRLFTKELVQANSEAPEPYFYYLMLHWPNEDTKKPTNTENLETYDEDLMQK